MVHKKKRTTQIAAIIALFAIIVSVVWTGILVILSSWNNANAPTFDVEEFMKNYSGSIDTVSWAAITPDAILEENQTWTTN